MKFAVTPDYGIVPAVTASPIHPSSSAATHPLVSVLVLKDSTAGHDTVYDLHWP